MNNTRISAQVLSRTVQDKPVRLFFDKDYNCHINAGSQFKIEDFDSGTIKDLNKGFASAMIIAARFSKNNIVLSNDIYDETMDILTESGKACYSLLGGSFRQALEAYNTDGNGANIFIFSPGSLPLLWEFVYTGSPLDQPNTGLFWGTRHKLTRILTGIQDGRICNKAASRFLFCQNKNLTYSGIEKKLLEHLTSTNGVDFSLLDEIFHQFSGDFSKSSDKVIRTWSAGNFDFIHIASHLEDRGNEEGILNSKIRLTLADDEVNLSLRYLLSRYDLEEFRLPRSPLVFLNACKTMTNPESLSHGQSFPRTFMKFGAGAVIATACDVPDLFANEFAKKYYEILLQSQSGWWDSLSESLRKTREYFLTEYHNPLGLAYGLYTQHDF